MVFKRGCGGVVFIRGVGVVWFSKGVWWGFSEGYVPLRPILLGPIST